MHTAGLDYPEPIVADGRLHRIKASVLHGGLLAAVERIRREINRPEQEALRR
jgi:hypothetical protein